MKSNRIRILRVISGSKKGSYMIMGGKYAVQKVEPEKLQPYSKRPERAHY